MALLGISYLKALSQQCSLETFYLYYPYNILINFILPCKQMYTVPVYICLHLLLISMTLMLVT